MFVIPHTTPETTHRHPPASAGSDERAQYAARRTYAYDVGEQAALQRLISAEAYLFLYKELVRLCKDRTYCWAGVAWMTERLAVSEGTIKRWLRQLVEAGLIERTPRPGGDTALTRVPALVAYDAQLRQAQTDPVPPAYSSHGPSTPGSSNATPVQPLFFVPREGITDESRDDSHLIRPSVKRQKRISGMVGNPPQSSRHNTLPQSGVQPLALMGVCGPGVLDELSGYTPDEIAAICRYVERQRNSYNPAGLAVFLARSGFGRTLLRSKPRRNAAGSVHHASSSLPPVPDAPGSEVEAPRPFNELWREVQTQLAQQIPVPEFATWLQETCLVALDDDRAVVGVPNIFARDTVQTAYAQLIQDVVADLTGMQVVVDVVIDRGG